MYITRAYLFTVTETTDDQKHVETNIGERDGKVIIISARSCGVVIMCGIVSSLCVYREIKGKKN